MATTASEKISTKKTSTAKPKAAATKPATSKPATKTSAKSTSKPKATKKSSKLAVTPEQRYLMVQEAAYYIAEKDGFAGNPSDYWAQAEAQISQMVA